MSWHPDYDDSYPTCYETHATFRLFHEQLDPSRISERLGLEPTSQQRRGEHLHPDPRHDVPAMVGGWFLSTGTKVDSKDIRRHIDWLVEMLGPRREQLEQLREEGVHMDVHCYWGSAAGHGGPTLSAAQMEQLARLGLDVWFDVYFVGDDTPEAS